MEEMREALRQSPDEWLADHSEMEFTYRHDCSIIDPEHPIVNSLLDACEAAGRPTTVSAMTASCDAWMYNNQLDIPTLVFGPGSLGVAHSDREHIVISDVLKGTEILTAFVAHWCGVQ